MKKSDIFFVLFLLLLFLPFILFEGVYRFYDSFYGNYPFISSFIKFAILATSGELVGLRIRTGKYFRKGFGIAARAFVWGLLGISIQAAFVIFAHGVPQLLEFAGMKDAQASLAGNLTFAKVGVAFSISVLLNIFYAPVLMTVHKITDSHIDAMKGSFKGFFSRIDMLGILGSIDWNVHWGFVLRKTIVLFWIPAQTLNFLMPEQFRVLIAAVYGIILGIILAFAAISKSDV